MGVRAKFKVQRIERSMGWVHKTDERGQVTHSDGEIQTVVLQVVTGGSEENDQFFASTPSGEIRLGSVNPDAIGQFGLGQEVYVSFESAS